MKTTAIVHNPERKAEWLPIFGGDRVPVQSPLPIWAELPIGRRLIYMLDLGQLTDKELCALVAHIARKFQLDPDAVRQEIFTIGVPILADEVMVISDNPMAYLISLS